MQPQITIMCSLGPLLTKSIALGGDGKPVSDGSACRMQAGTAVTTPAPDAATLAGKIDALSCAEAVDRKIVDCLQEFTVVMPRLSAARLHSVKHFKCDQPVPLRHSRQHVRLPDAGHAVIRTIPDSRIRQKSISGIPSMRPKYPKTTEQRAL